MVRGDSFKTRINVTALAILIAAGGAVPARAASRAEVSRICHQNQGSRVKDKQCTAAKDLLNGANSNKATAAVWTGVSVVCAAACLNWAGTGACTASNVAGGAASTLIQKDFAGGLTSLGGNAVNSLLGKKKDAAETAGEAAPAAGEALTEGTTPARKNGAGPCLTAAQTTSTSVRKYKDANQNENQIGDLKKNADTLNSGAGGANKPVVGTGGFAGSGPDQSAAAAGSIPGENVICSEDNIKTARGALACAGQANPNLPADVTSGRFLADLERITGKSADQFFAEFKNPVTTLATEIGGRLPSENQAAFGNGLAALAREAASMPGAGTQIAVAGGGARGAGFDPDLDSMGGMEDALKGLLGGGQKTEEPGAAGEMQAGGKVARAPAFVSPEDKTISLFDRVKWRYGALIQRERMGEGL